MNNPLEWLNENELRSYPLQNRGKKQLSDTVDLNGVFVDAQLMYDSVPSTVYLESVAVDGTEYTINVTGQSFVLDTDGAEYPAYIRNANGSLLVVTEKITGMIAVTLPLNTDASITFEPVCCFSTGGLVAGCSSLTFNRTDRLTGTQLSSSGELIGTIALSGLYQTNINVAGQTINIEVGRNKGTPISCENWFDGLLLDDCESTVSSINGILPSTNPGEITLQPGRHLRIYADKEYHRLYIGLDFDADDLCAPSQQRPVTDLV